MKKTRNAEGPTPFIEWLRVREDDGVYRSKATTLNAQCSTSNAQLASKPRFDLDKLKVCLKELKESRRWLRLLLKARLVPEQKMVAILGETEELIKIFYTSIRTAQKNPETEST